MTRVRGLLRLTLALPLIIAPAGPLFCASADRAPDPSPRALQASRQPAQRLPGFPPDPLLTSPQRIGDEPLSLPPDLPAPDLIASGADASAAVAAEYDQFLRKLGFRDYPAMIEANLQTPGLSELQRNVLHLNQRRYRVFNAARGLAAEMMSGLAEQGYSESAMETAAELGARLLALQPLSPPSALPVDVAKKDRNGVVEWLGAVTTQKMNQQLLQLVSDALKTAYAPGDLDRNIEAVHAGGEAREQARDFLARAGRIGGYSRQLLTTAYTDGEIGQTRYAGRAFAASLARFSRRENRPEVEALLKKKAAERGLRIENFVGDTLSVHDASAPGEAQRLRVETGDFLGERSGGLEAAQITFAVRPPPRLWFKAWRRGLLGGFAALLVNPKLPPKDAASRSLGQRLRFGVWKIRTWLAERAAMRKGFSHVGMAFVEAADGVAMAWALDNYPNAGEGGVRKIGITEQFAQNGPYLRLGSARFDAQRLWRAFQDQAARFGYRTSAYKAEDGAWPSLISREDFDRLTRIPSGEAPRLAEELTQNAASVIEQMMTRLGVGFAYGFSNELWRAYCSATLVLAYRLGGQFEIQSRFDHWHPLVVVMKRLGIGDAKNQKTQDRIIWPGSLFIDPKIASLKVVNYPPFAGVGRVADPFSLPGYVEMDPVLTAKVASLMHGVAPGSLTMDPDAIAQAIRTHLDNRSSKNRSKSGIRSGANASSGYSAGLEELLGESDDQ